MKRSILLSLLAASVAFCQVPTISNVAALDIDHTGGRIYYTVTPANSYVQVLWGTSPGNHPCATQAVVANHVAFVSAASFAINGNYVGSCAFTPGQTIYYVPTAWTNDNNYANVCNVSACGSGEYSFTTLGAVTHPVQPVAPAGYSPSHPDTSTYTIVPMTTSGSACVAASNVAAPAGHGWSSGVTAGDSFQTVLMEIGYATVIELPQGVTCSITPDVAGRALYVPGKCPYPGTSGISDPAHPWIVLRTHSNSSSDFPPFGFRTGPQFASKMAKVQPTVLTSPSGMLFYANMDYGTPHHWWFENFETSVPSSATSGVVGIPFYFGQNNDGTNSGPKYMVIDRVFSDFTNTAARGAIDTAGWVIMEGQYFLLTGNYIKNLESFSAFVPAIESIEGGIGNYTVDNNYLDYVGMGIYLEQLTGPKGTNDVVITHNYLTQQLTKMQPQYPGALPGVTWDGLTRFVRQPIESKGTYRMLIQGNFISNYWAMQNDAPAFFVSGINTALPTSGTSGNADWLITDNVIRHGATLFTCMGIRPWDNIGPPDNAVNRRIRFTNNLAYDLGRYKYSQMNSPSLLSGIVEMLPACEDVTIDHNTIGQSNYASNGGIIYYPSIEALGGSGTFLEGHFFTDNVFYFNAGLSTGTSGIALVDTGNVNPSQPAVPAVTGGSYSSILQSAGGATWERNVVIGGNSTTDGVHFTDLTNEDIRTYSQLMPHGDIWVPGNTQVERETNAGLNADWSLGVTAYSTGDAGANLNAITSATGVVSDINIILSSSSVQFSYLAPDTRSCSLDTSRDGSTWTRIEDAGGLRPRQVRASGLIPSSTYQYRLMCYFDQTNDLEFAGDRITTGVFTTLGTEHVTVPIAFDLSAYP